MELTKALEADIIKFMEEYWDTYLSGDLEKYDSFIRDDYHNIGTTEVEDWRSKADMMRYSETVIDQIVGTVQIRNRKTHIMSIDPYFMVHEYIDLYINTGVEWVFYSKMRLSSLIEKSNHGLQVVHQHGSVPDTKAQDGETIGFQKISQENLELREAIRRRTIELEQKNRELEVEASLEKIRGLVTSMQESTDLLDIMVNIRSEFVALGHEAHYFWYMRWFNDKYEKAMTSGDGTQVGMIMTLPRHIHGDIPLVANWEQGDEPTLIFAMDVETAVEYVDKMITLGDFEQVDPHAPTLDDIRHIGGLTFIMARTSQGEIGYSLPGEVHHPPEEAVNTLARFAGVFDLAYRRFEDLKAAEHQALLIREERDRLEVALNELHATQTQLIQQEKLASLGQLTAGIAHEIKNPLNFVNNFSEVSIEMIEEALDELAKAKTQHAASQLEAIQETENILSDIKSNLSKIHEHGSRADGIVKSMLMHSRGGSGKMEPTDLNALIKEYVNLSFHGMRAGKTPINVDIQLDLDDSFGKIALIEEDFSRVLLNLCNNAFDAMREKTKTDNGYKPLLSISTKQLAEVVEIAITDNGPGIPDEIKDKILQPFFTTKKGTEGTGLGLSITHDIVKAHGGELDIQSERNEGTTFTITLKV